MAATPLDAVIGALQKVTGPDRQGWYTALCVFHNDQQHPNLRVNREGFVCFACGEKGSLDSLADKVGLARARVEDRIVTTYDYRAPNGQLLFQVVRLFPKDFRQRRPDGVGGWKWDLKGITPVLYRLPELMSADPEELVFVCEGEKDVDRLRSLGLTATTNPMGADKWRPAYSLMLKGRNVVLLPDNDEPGRHHMEKVRQSLKAYARSVRTLGLPGLPLKGDASDWVDAGNDKQALLRLAEGVEPEASQEPTAGFKQLISARELLTLDLPEPKWAVQGLVPEGLSILGGKPKMGKSWMALNFAVSVAAGGTALGVIPVQQGEALYLALEDTPRRLQDRFKKLLHGEPAPIGLTLATEWPRLDEGGLEDLEVWLSTHRDARLVIIDTLAKVRAARRRSDTLYEGDYEVVATLKQLADRNSVAIIVIHHLRKQDSSDPVDSLSGTLGLSGAADAVLVLKRERGQHDAVLFATGRDVEESELALAWNDTPASWVSNGETESNHLSSERKDVLDLFESEGGRKMRPSTIAKLLEKSPGATRKLVWNMSKDGLLRTDGGYYWPAPGGNKGNLGKDRDAGNSGNTTLSKSQARTPVTSRRLAEVTQFVPRPNLTEAERSPVTAVTDTAEFWKDEL